MVLQAPCESFWTESQLVDGKCPDCGREVKPAKEEAYFLRLSKYQKQLEDFIEEHPNFIYPESRKKEMVNNFIKYLLNCLFVMFISYVLVVHHLSGAFLLTLILSMLFMYGLMHYQTISLL